MNLYSILEIKPNASEIEIKKAYFMLSKKYHPDKCKDSDANEKFYRINMAYQILTDEQNRKKYLKMNIEEKSKLHKLLEKIFSNKLNIDGMKDIGISFTKKDWSQLETHFTNIMSQINFKQIFNMLMEGSVPNVKNNNSTCSDSEVEYYDETYAEYYYDLPINYNRHNKLDIRLNLNVTLEDLINNNKRKIRVKRQFEDEQHQNDFIFNLDKPFIIFQGGGDMDDGNYGDLIFKLILPPNFYWRENVIIYDYSITVYQMIYGLDIRLNCGTLIEYKNWVPSRDGLIINVDKINISNYSFAIKLTLAYEHSSDKEEILQNFFN